MISLAICPGSAHPKVPAQSLRVDRRSSTLASTIEGEVIPRLMLAHRVTRNDPGRRRDEDFRATSEDVAELARLVLDHDEEVAASFVAALQAQGASVEILYVELLAPTAKLLGDMWQDDLCDFTDVTVGLSRLQQLLRGMGPAFENEASQQYAEGRILLIPMPGEQHTLGIMILEEMLRREGWECCSSMPRTVKEMCRIVKAERFDVIGLSVSSDLLLCNMSSAIQALRKASRNKSVMIMVGGPVFLEHPEYVAQVGADGTARDARDAVQQLRSVLDAKVPGLR